MFSLAFTKMHKLKHVQYMIRSRSYGFLFTLTIAFIAIFDYKFNIQNFTFISQSMRP